MSKKVTIPTVKFQDMVSRAVRGASENKLLPITSMMCIEMKNNVLTLTTTDTANTLKVRADKIQGEDMYAVVPVAKFSTLISRVSSDSVTLEMTDKLIVHANGKYEIDLCVDEDGVVQFPEYQFEKEGEGKIINLSSIKNIIDINKPTLAKTVDTPALCGYFVGKRVITSDADSITFNDMDVMDGEYLLSAEMMDMLSLFKQEKITWWYSNGAFLFETDDMVLYGVEYDGKEEYPADAVSQYLEVDFPSHCKLSKISIQDVLSRLAIFVEPYDKNGAYFTFTADGLQVSSKKNSSNETIVYQQSDNFAPFHCCANITMLKNLVDACPDESMELYYGDEDCFKFTAGKVTQVMALMVDEGAANG